MKTKLIEVTNGFNWGKFAVSRYDEEWSQRSSVGTESNLPMLTQIGWGREHLWVLDLQTGEGACFRPGGSASADLDKHKVWVCPMFAPFLHWLYKQPLEDLDALPALVELTEDEAPSSMYGYRRGGPSIDLGAFTIQECDALTAALVGVIASVPPEADEVRLLLTSLQHRFIVGSVECREANGIPVD